MEQNRHYRGGQRQRTQTEQYYVDGNTIRKAAPLPKYRPKARPDRQAQQKRSVQTAQLERQRQINQRIAMRNREKALRIDWKYTMFLCAAVLSVLVSCVLYLSVQSQLTQKNSEISNLRSELAALTDANSATRERINEAVDLEFVKKYATEQLGMVYPTEDQIMTYQSSDEDYVKQYLDIPQSTD